MEESGKHNGYTSLDDLAFKGRNTMYGAYYLRKRYSRFLLLAMLIATLVFVLIFVSAFLYYYFGGVEPNLEMYDMEIVEVLPMPPPEKNELLIETPPAPAPPEEKKPPPVISDTVVEKNEREPEKIQKEEDPVADSAAKNGKGASQGTGTQEGTQDNTIYTLIDVFPRYPGGDNARLYFLRTHIRYPEAAVKNRVQGVVIVVFVIERDGSVTNVQVAKGIGGGCDEEAIRVVKGMPSWEPGKRSGRAVRVMVRMPIVFRIPGKP